MYAHIYVMRDRETFSEARVFFFAMNENWMNECE
jgi:hypothetical protein